MIIFFELVPRTRNCALQLRVIALKGCAGLLSFFPAAKVVSWRNFRKHLFKMMPSPNSLKAKLGTLFLQGIRHWRIPFFFVRLLLTNWLTFLIIYC
jgi:hypothetical protein